MGISEGLINESLLAPEIDKHKEYEVLAKLAPRLVDSTRKQIIDNVRGVSVSLPTLIEAITKSQPEGYAPELASFDHERYPLSGELLDLIKDEMFELDHQKKLGLNLDAIGFQMYTGRQSVGDEKRGADLVFALTPTKDPNAPMPHIIWEKTDYKSYDITQPPPPHIEKPVHIPDYEDSWQVGDEAYFHNAWQNDPFYLNADINAITAYKHQTGRGKHKTVNELILEEKAEAKSRHLRSIANKIARNLVETLLSKNQHIRSAFTPPARAT
jgi:hypothetical protein